MSLGRNVISTVLRTGRIGDFLDVGMDAAWLSTPESSAVFGDSDREPWRWLASYWDKHGTVNQEQFEKAYPEYRVREQRYKISELLGQAREDVRRYILLEIMNVISDTEDVDEATASVREHMDKLTHGVLSRQDGGAVQLGAFDFDEWVNQHIEPWIPLGIKEIDEAFGTFQPGQLITLVGRQKSTKSTLMAWSALAAWEEGFECLFYNVELDLRFLRQKMLSIGAHTSPERLRRGPDDDTQKLWRSEKRKLREFHGRLNDEGVPFSVVQKYSAFTVKDVRADIERYDPHAIYIDGFYFMEATVDGRPASASSDWRAIEHLAAELKALAMEKDVTIIISTQSQEKQQGSKKKPGIEAKTIQGGTGLLKASDLVLGLDIDDRGQVFVNDIRNRFGHIDPIQVTWNWEEMRMLAEPYVDQDEERDRQRDRFVAEMEDA